MLLSLCLSLADITSDSPLWLRRKMASVSWPLGRLFNCTIVQVVLLIIYILHY